MIIEISSSKWNSRFKKKWFIKNIHFFPLILPDYGSFLLRFIQKKKKERKISLSLSLVLWHRSFLTNTRFFSQPVCNLIKREVSKSTKESSIDLCATRRPTRIDFSLHFSAARKKFDCPDWCTECKNKEIVDLYTRIHGSFVGPGSWPNDFRGWKPVFLDENRKLI